MKNLDRRDFSKLMAAFPVLGALPFFSESKADIGARDKYPLPKGPIYRELNIETYFDLESPFEIGTLAIYENIGLEPTIKATLKMRYQDVDIEVVLEGREKKWEETNIEIDTLACIDINYYDWFTPDFSKEITLICACNDPAILYLTDLRISSIDYRYEKDDLIQKKTIESDIMYEIGKKQGYHVVQFPQEETVVDTYMDGRYKTVDTYYKMGGPAKFEKIKGREELKYYALGSTGHYLMGEV